MVDQSIKLISVPCISSDCSSFNLTEWSKHKLANSNACGVRYSLSPSVSCSNAAQTRLTPKQQQHQTGRRAGECIMATVLTKQKLGIYSLSMGS